MSDLQRIWKFVGNNWELCGETGGLSGADGKTVLSGTGAPTTEGVEGDFYIDTDENNIYGPKTGELWGSPTSLIGADGADGVNGSGGWRYEALDGNINGGGILAFSLDWGAGAFPQGQFYKVDIDLRPILGTSLTSDVVGIECSLVCSAREHAVVHARPVGSAKPTSTGWYDSEATPSYLTSWKYDVEWDNSAQGIIPINPTDNVHFVMWYGSSDWRSTIGNGGTRLSIKGLYKS